jgi:hypothetical protein
MYTAFNESRISCLTAQAKSSLSQKPEWLAAWKSQEENLASSVCSVRVHKTTLGRMRRQGKIEATKFAGEWYFKPETALPPVGNEIFHSR